ncbi:zinc finger MYM-type protein 1 [Tanacetum coccineum]
MEYSFFFKDYKETGYSKSIEEAKQIAIEMDIDPVFTQKRVIHRKKHFVENSDSQDVLFSAKESFKLKSYDDNSLMACCSLLEAALKKNYKSGIDANELCVELRLNGLALIAIENDILENVDYELLINKFAAKNARRMALFMN